MPEIRASREYVQFKVPVSAKISSRVKELARVERTTARDLVVRWVTQELKRHRGRLPVPRWVAGNSRLKVRMPAELHKRLRIACLTEGCEVGTVIAAWVERRAR